MRKLSWIGWLSAIALCAMTLLTPMLIAAPIKVSAADVERALGDIDGNGTVNVVDVSQLYRYVAGLTMLQVSQLRVADIDGSGSINMSDVSSLYRTIAGLQHLPTIPTQETTQTEPTGPTEPTDPTTRPTYAPESRPTVTGTSTTVTTTPTSLVGIDVSYAQGEINWEVAATEIDFAILRCGYGQDEPGQQDLRWEENAAACEQYGIPYGAYFFCYARTAQEAYGEALHALRLLEGKNLTYPVFYDLEYSDWQGNLKPEDYATFATIFCDVLSAYGYKVGIYSNLNWWTERLTAPCFDQWYRWMAQYNDTCDYQGIYHMWQYSDAGVLEGIAENTVDMNYTYVDFATLEQMTAAPSSKEELL
ncbi:MAG: hypothetical protein IKV35_00285 [Clostridia bacterium]|nr:hypothetical protein [Clostridia bacterium]